MIKITLKINKLLLFLRELILAARRSLLNLKSKNLRLNLLKKEIHRKIEIHTSRIWLLPK